MRNEHWIEDAHMNKGSFSTKAKKRGVSTTALAAQVRSEPHKYSTKMRKEAALAITLSHLRHKAAGRAS